MFKKFTCMALTFFMLLTMLPAVYADDAMPPEGETNIAFTDVDMQSNMGKAIQKLVEKNIINGYEDNTFKPEQTITRAEFTAIIARWKNVDEQVEENPVTGFPDVDNQEVYWAKKYIRAIKDLNIINGFEDGTFRPNEPVTYEQAIKMVVASLGYKDLAWPQGWIDMANQKALLTDVSHQGQQTDPVNRGNVAVLVFNSLEVPPVAEQTAPPTQSAAPTQTKKPSTGGGSGGPAIKPQETPKIDYGTVTGVLDATWYTGLSYGDNKLDKTQLSIDGVVYDTEGISESSIVNKIGYRVTLKVKKEKNGPWIGYALSEDSANSTVSVQNDFIESFAFDEESGYYLLDYYRKDGGPMLTAKIQPNVKIIYNERAVEPSEINEAYIKNMLDKLIANEGSVELVNNDTKSANFEVLRVSLFETFVAKSANKSTRSLSFFYGADPITVPEEDTFSNVIRFSGSIKEFNGIQKYCVLRIQRSLDNFYMTLDASLTKRSGTLTSVSSSGKIGLDNGTGKHGLV